MIKSNEEARQFGVWYVDCSAPSDAPTILPEKIAEYMKTTHGVDIKGLKVQKKMVLHVDGSDFFASTYEFEVNGKKFLECSRHKRRGMNAHIWAHDE